MDEIGHERLDGLDHRARRQTNGSSVTCRITVDGKVADEQTSTGKYAVVNCTAAAI
ncbi:MmpS family transport accessory protein [Nocardia ignorata]|uniref:MmpS family transport accessory protein n=1 Tax=Nocardia ignorata TaxID=145285 RepID=UPI000AEF51BD